MSFLNATLLFGSFAILVPVVLHLLGRREPQRVPFPAVRFLTERLQSNRRRMQVKRWVLLALRILLLALLALALAQPHVHRAMLGDWLTIGGIGLLSLITLGLFLWSLFANKAAWLRWSLLTAAIALLVATIGWGARTIAGGPPVVNTRTAPAAIVFLIDNGPTSGYGLTAGLAEQKVRNTDWRLGKARDAALWLLARYPLESRFAVVDRSSRPAAFALDPASVQRGLQNIMPLQATRPLSERIEAGLRLLRSSDLPRRNLYIFTDLTESSWNASGGQVDWPSIVAEVAQEPQVTINIIDIGAETYENRVLGEVALSDSTPPRNVPITVSALVTWDRFAEGQAAMEPASDDGANGDGREFIVQARLFDQQRGLPLERDGKIEYPRLKTVDRNIIKLKSSAERVNLTLPPLDYGIHHGLLEILPDDNLPVDNVRYFTVKVKPPSKILLVCNGAPEQKILSAMLNPFGNADERREYIIDFATNQTLANLDLRQYAAIGLFNPSLPNRLVRDALNAWVRDGGSLFVAIGNLLDRDGTGESIEWPLIGNPKRIWRVPEPGTFAQLIQPNHPVTAPLAAVQGGAPWNAFRIYNYWQLSDEALFSVLLRYSDTEHLTLGEQRLGQGRVMLLTTPLPAVRPPAENWNDLLSSSLSGDWEVYFILLRYIFEDLTGGLSETLNFKLGEPVVLDRSSDDVTSFQLFAPDLPPVQLDVAQQQIVPGIPAVAGNYWLRGVDSDSLGYSANLEIDSTRLARITPDVLDEVFGKDQYQLVRNRDEIELAEGDANQARSLYPIAMLMIAAIFILEQLLANRFYPAGNSNTQSLSGKRSGTANRETVVAA